VQRLQEPELHGNQEQEEAYGSDGDKEVLQHVQKTHNSPRGEMMGPVERAGFEPAQQFVMAAARDKGE
jgi:hypothetical protein